MCVDRNVPHPDFLAHLRVYSYSSVAMAIFAAYLDGHRPERQSRRERRVPNEGECGRQTEADGGADLPVAIEK